MDQETYEELLFPRTLTTDTKGESIFNDLRYFFIEIAIPSSNIISAAADGAPAMFGCDRGFISHLKPNVPGVFAIHCVIHRQHLVVKNLSDRLHQSLQIAKNAVNKICSCVKKMTRTSINYSLTLKCAGCQKAYVWQGFFSLFETVSEFLNDKGPILKEKLMKQNISRREFSQFGADSQDDDVSAYVQHLNVLHTNF